MNLLLIVFPIDDSRMRYLVLQKPIQPIPELLYDQCRALWTLEHHLVIDSDHWGSSLHLLEFVVVSEEDNRQRINHSGVVDVVGRGSNLAVVDEKGGLEC